MPAPSRSVLLPPRLSPVHYRVPTGQRATPELRTSSCALPGQARQSEEPRPAAASRGPRHSSIAEASRRERGWKESRPSPAPTHMIGSSPPGRPSHRSSISARPGP
ncbi:hypothetical protein NDU88_008874 [Pleurodeles waltl]|uniref:Uncharacterized protein n=1 Tax=Pleurodeles waltl TaxID=8319 RepID=A0AAV7QR82_PLEWA|nr:hypothetical protein NDU88_008874 [Pleurodeles waltl]